MAPRRHLRIVLGLALASLLVSACGQLLPTPTARPTSANTIAVTDIVGRTVQVKRPAERILLGEARQLYVLAVLEPEDPFKRVVGWPDDLRTADFDTYNKYRATFPGLAEIPVFGSAGAGQFSAEKAIELKPDLLVLNFDAYDRARETGLIDQLARVGIPTVVIDFRQYPLENTVPSVVLLGKVMGKEERAQQLVDFYLQQLNQVYARLDKLKGAKPVAFMYRAAGSGSGDCCNTFGRGNLGVLFERAGGVNLASDLLPGWQGAINPEQVIASDPELFIVTGSNWTNSPGSKGFVGLGYGADPATVQEQLRALTRSQPGWADLRAVKSGRVHAIWHQFYNSPYHFVALQEFAKWAYPDAFADVDPEKNFREFHQKFLPVEYSGAFWATLEP